MADQTPPTTTRTMARKWDTDTAACAIVLGALLFLFLIHRGFRGLVVGVS